VMWPGGGAPGAITTPAGYSVKLVEKK
jgi:hypothetical protein